jgi:hypothetical protein
MAVDFGFIRAGDKTEPVAEVEFELLRGDTGDLISFIALLARETPLYAEHRSKYHRGCQLAGEELILPAGGGLPDITGGASWQTSLYGALIRQTGHLLFCLANTALHPDERAALRILGRELSVLKKIILFAHPFCTSREQQKLQDLSEAVETSLLLDELSENWRKIKQQTNLHVNEALDGLLAHKREEAALKLSQGLAQGVYGAALFSLWAGLEDMTKKAYQELSLTDFVTEKTASLADRLRQTEQSQTHSEDLAAFAAALYLGLASSKKALPKDFARIEKKLGKIAADLERNARREKTGQLIFSLFKTAASRLVYRDAGILYGALWQDLRLKQKKFRKRSDSFVRLCDRLRKETAAQE